MNVEIIKHRVQVYTQHLNDGTERRWLVDAALAVIEQSELPPNADISLECAKEGLRRNPYAWELLPKNIAKADLNQPIIFATVIEEGREVQVLIDGWHRVRKMVQLGRTEPIKVYILSVEVSKEIEL